MGKRQTIMLLREQAGQPEHDRLISQLVGMIPDQAPPVSGEKATVASIDLPAPPDPPGNHTDDEQLLCAQLQRAYVAHALANLLPARRSAFAKRTLDLALGLPLALLSVPIILMLALTLHLGLGKTTRPPKAPIFMRQRYIGRNGRAFVGLSIPALRTTHLRTLASLPLIFNVIQGKMSLVGPRPTPYAALAGSAILSSTPLSLADSQPLARYAAKPGLTGPWFTQWRKQSLSLLVISSATSPQAHGNADPVDQPMCDDPDLAYVTHGSLGSDLAILAQTPLALFRHSSPLPTLT